MNRRRRSGCPINLTLETFGDRWSLIVLRDTMFGRPRSFRSSSRNIEGIASNILADRLKRLTAHGLLSRSADPGHKQRVVYALTEKAIDLVPDGRDGQLGDAPHTALDRSPHRRAGSRGRRPELWAEFMEELRHLHLGAPRPEASVFAKFEGIRSLTFVFVNGRIVTAGPVLIGCPTRVPRP